MPEPPTDPRIFQKMGGGMIPPRGFKAEQYPLRHEIDYAFGLSLITSTKNSTIITLVKNYTDVTNVPSLVVVNPHNSNFEVDKGAICGPMSIIDKLTLSLHFTMTKDALDTAFVKLLRFNWTPIFFSFPEKLDAADEMTSTTVKDILELTKNATNEDITPTFSSKLDLTGPSELNHPTSSSNFTELFGTLNLTTDLKMEDVAFDAQTFHRALRYYTNKGALKACLGRTRHVRLGPNHISQSFFIKKFVPRAVRRIVPYSYFGILIHVPIQGNVEQGFASAPPAADGSELGVTAMIRYDEWHPDHHQDMTGDGS